tara:strand:- start:132 stop:425 length:294 start_codon:yes stop_codon:yes gene_type:complete
MMTYNALTILFYIIVNILILIVSAITYLFGPNVYIVLVENIFRVAFVYLIALGVAFWFYFKTNKSRNILVGTSFLIYLIFCFMLNIIQNMDESDIIE